MTARTPLKSARGKPSLQMSGYNHALGGAMAGAGRVEASPPRAGASPQGDRKGRPYYIRAGQADRAWRRDEPDDRPDSLKFAPRGCTKRPGERAEGAKSEA